MSWDRFIKKTTDEKKESVSELKQETQTDDYEVLVPHYNKTLKKYYISKVKFNPENFETYEMQEKALAKQFENEQKNLNIFYTRYKREKK